MAAWLLILGGAALLVVVVALVAVVWILSGRAKPGGTADTNIGSASRPRTATPSEPTFSTTSGTPAPASDR